MGHQRLTVPGGLGNALGVKELGEMCRFEDQVGRACQASPDLNQFRGRVLVEVPYLP
jgi:hypothetical protein